jgi:hypothetical protein
MLFGVKGYIYLYFWLIYKGIAFFLLNRNFVVHPNDAGAADGEKELENLNYYL